MRRLYFPIRLNRVAYWIEDDSRSFCYCSRCRAKSSSAFDNYCYECGAFMKKELNKCPKKK